MLRWRKWSTPVPYQEKISTVSNPQGWAYQHCEGDKLDTGFVPWELALNFWSGNSNLIFFLSTSLHEYFNVWRHKFWICLCIHRFLELSFFPPSVVAIEHINSKKSIFKVTPYIRRLTISTEPTDFIRPDAQYHWPLVLHFCAYLQDRYQWVLISFSYPLYRIHDGYVLAVFKVEIN